MEENALHVTDIFKVSVSDFSYLEVHMTPPQTVTVGKVVTERCVCIV
jgi:hypothetical protein